MSNPVIDGYTKCVLCDDNILGWGNNPYPVADEGECCDYCNDVHVIPARIEQMMSNKKKIELAC